MDCAFVEYYEYQRWCAIMLYLNVYTKMTCFISDLNVSCDLICLIASGTWFHNLGPSTIKSLSQHFKRVRGTHRRSQVALLVCVLCILCSYMNSSAQLIRPAPLGNLCIILQICWHRHWYNILKFKSSCISSICQPLRWHGRLCSEVAEVQLHLAELAYGIQCPHNR